MTKTERIDRPIYIYHHRLILNSSRLFCSLAVLGPRVGHTMDVLSPFTLSSVILIDSATGNPVHVLMLSIQAVCGLTPLRSSDIVPCIIFSNSSRLLQIIRDYQRNHNSNMKYKILIIES